QHPSLSATVVPIHHAFDAAEVASTSTFAQLVQATAAEITGVTRPVCGTPYGSDVRNLINNAHMEAITFVPGDVSMCHCPDERQSLDDLHHAALVMVRVASALLLAS